MHRFILLLALSLPLALGRRTDDRWLQQPKGHVKVIQGSDLHMIYEYARPPRRPTVGKLYFAHHMPEQQHENILIEAKLNPNNGTVTILYEMFPGKVSVMSQGRRITIRMDNLTLADSGQYLTDVNFDMDAALHDDVVLSVFAEPSVSKVHANVLVQSISNFTTFAWKFNVNSSRNQPQITSITMSHLNESEDWVDFIRHTWNLSLKQWLLVYPDTSRHFRDRISYCQGPRPDQVQLTLGDLQLSDKGKYKIRVLYEDEIFTYDDITILHVTTGYGWRFVPSKETLIAESRSFTLNFWSDIVGFKSKNMTFKLFRQINGSESICALMNINHSVLKSSSMMGPCVERWSGKYNKSEQRVVLSISNTRVEDASSYRAIFLDSDNIVLQHEFDIFVIKDEDLTPMVSNITQFINNTGIQITISSKAPRANITLYEVTNGAPHNVLHQANETRYLRTKLPELRDNVVMVKTEFIGIDVDKFSEYPIQGAAKHPTICPNTCNCDKETFPSKCKRTQVVFILQIIIFMITVLTFATTWLVKRRIDGRKAAKSRGFLKRKDTRKNVQTHV